MTRLRAWFALASLPVVLALGAAPAYAGYPNTPKGAQHDCGAGHYPLQGHYTIAVLIKALAGLSTSDVEYTTCKDAIEAAIRTQEQQAHHHHPPKKTHTTTSPTSTTHTTTTHTTTTHATHTKTGHHHPRGGASGPTGAPISSQQISAAVTNGRMPRRVNGVVYTPGAVTTRNTSFISSIPNPILALLAALIVVLGGFGGWALRSVVRARRSG